MSAINGTPVNFTFNSAAGVTLSGSADDGLTFANLNGILLQSADYKKNSNRVLVKDGNGNRVTSAHSDYFNSATLKWKVSGTNLAGAITNTTLSRPGNFVKITACDTMPDLVSASNKWEVVGGSVTGTNEDVKEITLELEYAAGIQSRAV
jgi:hypothetical protein